MQYGDLRGSSINMRLMGNMRRISNYPIINEGRSIGLMKKLRAEANQAYDNLQAMIGNNVEGMALKYAEMEKKLIEENLTRIRDADDKQKLSQKFIELKDKYNSQVKSKADLQSELIRSEEEKLQISKSLVELQIENTKPIKFYQFQK